MGRKQFLPIFIAVSLFIDRYYSRQPEGYRLFYFEGNGVKQKMKAWVVAIVVLQVSFLLVLDKIKKTKQEEKP